MPEDAEVHLHLDHVLMRVGAEVSAGMAAIAYQIEGRAKVKVVENDQIDTGFMLNAIYPVTKKGSGFMLAATQAEAKADREVIDETMPSEDEAMVVAGANYSIYQEMRQSFLYAGALDVANDLGGLAEIERVFREENHD
jgi:hypothetical protein